jgi:hypothetical protein
MSYATSPMRLAGLREPAPLGALKIDALQGFLEALERAIVCHRADVA